MFACRSAVMLILISVLSACSGIEHHRAPSPQASAGGPRADTASAWGCDNPQPGHPTTAEKKAFVEEVGTLATRAEENYGVPAAAITAMAILESGYGWTRLAQNTNNLLAWKYFAGAPGSERDFWVLKCPEKGTSDQFIVFHDRAEAIAFAADQLASSDNYRTATDRYRRDRTNGVDVVEAVNRWVDGIAEPYSSQPEAYRTAVRRILKDTYGVQGGSLYSLSEAVSPPRA